MVYQVKWEQYKPVAHMLTPFVPIHEKETAGQSPRVQSLFRTDVQTNNM